MNYLSVILIVLCAAAITLYTFYFIRTLPRRRNAAEQKRYGRESEFRVYQLLCRALGSDRVINNLYLPVPTKEGTFDTEVDAVCVTKGGICVIEIKGSKGLIENPPSGRWCQRHGEKKMYFDDPHTQNRTHVRALQRLLDDKGIDKPHLYNTVVFSDTSVQFTHKYDWLVRYDRLEGYIREMDSRDILSRYEIRQIVKLLKYYRIPHNITFKNKFRNRRY